MDIHDRLGALSQPDLSSGPLLLLVGAVLGLALGLVLTRSRWKSGGRTHAAGEPDAVGTPAAAIAPGAQPGRAPAHLAPALPQVEADPASTAVTVLPPLVAAISPALVERPIVIKPDPPRPVSRFAPDPGRFGQGMGGAYANAPAPSAGTSRAVRSAVVTGTVVDTVSTRLRHDVIDSATVPPPIRHILPRPVNSAPGFATPVITASPPPKAVEAAPPRYLPEATGSMLGEIGGLRQVEVRTARRGAGEDQDPGADHAARESYEQRARQLERVAHERLMREQERLAIDIREQLAHDKRQLESVLDNRLEDTVLRPIALPVTRTARVRFPGQPGGVGTR